MQNDRAIVVTGSGNSEYGGESVRPFLQTELTVVAQTSEGGVSPAAL
jgi:hypothetical protein